MKKTKNFLNIALGTTLLSGLAREVTAVQAEVTQLPSGYMQLAEAAPKN